MHLLLISTSRIYGSGYFDYCADAVVSFLGPVAFVRFVPALVAALLGARDASASPLFELAGSTTGDGGFNAGVTGDSSSATYFNPALLPYAPQAFETGTLLLTDQI